MSKKNIISKLSSIDKEFPKQNLDRWWKKVESELGSKRDLDEITWKLEDGISISPMPPKFQANPTACFTRQAWSIVEEWTKLPSEIEWEDLLEHGVDEIALSLASFEGIPEKLKTPPAISIFTSKSALESILPDSAISFAQVLDTDILHENDEPLPAWLPWRSARSPKDGSPSQRLSSILRQLIIHLRNESEPIPNLGSRYRVYISISTNYLTEIAVLRALRILLLNLWKAFGLDLKQSPKIYAELEFDAKLDENTNLIVQTSKAVSAVLGGADALSIKSPDTENNVHYRRLSRNIHHILRHESNLHHRVDPLQGSHLLEHLTTQFALKSWEEIKGVDL